MTEQNDRRRDLEREREEAFELCKAQRLPRVHREFLRSRRELLLGEAAAGAPRVDPRAVHVISEMQCPEAAARALRGGVSHHHEVPGLPGPDLDPRRGAPRPVG